MDKEKSTITRRDSLLWLGRVIGFGSVAGFLGTLINRRGISAQPNPTCQSGQACHICGDLPSCHLPAATPAREAIAMNKKKISKKNHRTRL